MFNPSEPFSLHPDILFFSSLYALSPVTLFDLSPWMEILHNRWPLFPYSPCSPSVHNAGYQSDDSALATFPPSPLLPVEGRKWKSVDTPRRLRRQSPDSFFWYEVEHRDPDHVWIPRFSPALLLFEVQEAKYSRHLSLVPFSSLLTAPVPQVLPAGQIGVPSFPLLLAGAFGKQRSTC